MGSLSKEESSRAVIDIEEEDSEIQPDNGSPATSPKADSDDDGASDPSEPDVNPDASRKRDGSKREAVIVRSGHNENHDTPPGRDGSKREVLELMFLLANFGVELMSIVFGQLSSQHKHKALYLLLCLIMSIFAVLISISELVYKLIKEWDFRKGETNWKSWLHDPPPGTGVRVGFFPCITALTCAFVQSIITTDNYSLYLKDGNAPINVSSSPIIYASGQLFIFLSFKGAKTETKPKLKPKPEPETESKEENKEVAIRIGKEEFCSGITLQCAESDDDGAIDSFPSTSDQHVSPGHYENENHDAPPLRGGLQAQVQTQAQCQTLRLPRRVKLWRKLKSKLKFKPKPGLWRKLKSKLKLKLKLKRD